MFEPSVPAREFFKTSDQTYVNKYGPERKIKFDVLTGVRATVMDAFDALAVDCKDVNDAQRAAHAFEVMWGLINSAHAELLAQEKH